MSELHSFSSSPTVGIVHKSAVQMIQSSTLKYISVMTHLELENAFQKLSIPEPRSMYRRRDAGQPTCTSSIVNREIMTSVHCLATIPWNTCHCSATYGAIRPSRQDRACETSLIWSPEKHSHTVCLKVMMRPLQVSIRGLILFSLLAASTKHTSGARNNIVVCRTHVSPQRHNSSAPSIGCHYLCP